MAGPGKAQPGGALLRRILAATDLSSRSDRALRRAAMLAQAAGAELLLLHAVDDDQPRSMIEAERREAGMLLRQQIAALPEVGHAAALVEEGDPFEAILALAEARAVDLVVLGEHRRRLLRDIFTGTTLERVMRHGHRPVLMVNAPPTGPYRRVLAATDLSAHSARALRTAARLGLLEDAALTVVHAFEPPGMGAMALAGMPDAAIAAHAADAGRQARTALAGFLASLGLDRPPQLLVEQGRPATVVKDAVARLRPDLLVIGTAGALRQALLGSVAAEVLAGVGCDALAVPPGTAR